MGKGWWVASNDEPQSHALRSPLCAARLKRKAADLKTGGPRHLATFAVNGRNQACQVKRQFWQVVGLRPARRASRPAGNRQMQTMITQTGKPAL
jgi:hypothetical protein